MITGLVAGAFDLIHPGYISMLRYTKNNPYVSCDFLTVALHVDPSIERPQKNKPVNSVADRIIVLKAIKYVDEVIPYDTEKDLENLIATLVPGYLYIGEDHENDDYTGKSLHSKLSFTPIFCPRQHNYSTTELRMKIFEAERDKFGSIAAPEQYGSNDMIRAVMPHCDNKILHAPGECEVCDKYSDWQEARKNMGINFTGHNDENKGPCPADYLRGDNHQLWLNNRRYQSRQI